MELINVKLLVRVRPGDSVAVPFFTEPAGLTLRHESFTVAALVYHLGDTALSGHYMTLIGKPQWRQLGILRV